MNNVWPLEVIRTKYSLADFESARDGIYPGPDLEWFAVDSLGYVGAFCSAGDGLVPSTVFASWELFNRTLDMVAALPRIGDADWVVDKPPRFVTWEVWACAGLFAFDWQPSPGLTSPNLRYGLFAVPTRPLLAADLPEEVAEYISGTRFESLEFASSRGVSL